MKKEIKVQFQFHIGMINPPSQVDIRLLKKSLNH